MVFILFPFYVNGLHKDELTNFTWQFGGKIYGKNTTYFKEDLMMKIYIKELKQINNKLFHKVLNCFCLVNS